MTDYTEEQLNEAIQKARVAEQWTIAEDTIRRQLKVVTENMIAQGIWHPFLRGVADTMYSIRIAHQFAPQPQQEQNPDETTKQD